MQSFIFAVNAVAPIIILVAIGYFLKCKGFMPSDFTKKANKIVFKVFLPVMLFLNTYKIENPKQMDFGYILFAVLGATVVFLISIPLVLLVTRDNGRRGALLQSTFRSNYALIGIPLAQSLFGDEGAVVATLLSAILIPVFNILAVISLSVFKKQTEKISIKEIIIEIVKNPLILSIFVGVVFLIIREITGFDLLKIDAISKPLSHLSNMTTPMALLVLGAEFEFSASKALRREIIFGTVMRTVLVPFLALSVALLIGDFKGAHFASFIAAFGTPVAVSSVPMVQEMGGDSALAGQLVVWTTLVSALTVFLFSFALKQIGVF